MRGLDNVRAEFSLTALTHNLRCHQHRRRHDGDRPGRTRNAPMAFQKSETTCLCYKAPDTLLCIIPVMVVLILALFIRGIIVQIEEWERRA
jgi:hypothetical protein